MKYTQENYDTVTDTNTLTTWDIDTTTVTVTTDGVVTETRPMTPQEITFWQEKTAADYGTPVVLMQGLMREYATTQNPETAPPWVAPTGAHDAYLPGAIVKHNGKDWRNDLPAANVWEPGTQNAQWFDLTPPVSGPQPWVQPTGSHDAYAVGAIVTHKGQTWVSNTAANVWEPGVYGWDVKP